MVSETDKGTHMKKIFSSRSGITLLETVIVLIIGSLIISGIWITYSQLSLNDKVRRTALAIDKTVIATREFLASRDTVPTDLSNQMHNRNLMPSELIFEGGIGVGTILIPYISPFGTRFIVTSVAASTQRLFVIQIRFNIGSAECTRLVPLVMGNIGRARETGRAGFILGAITRGEAPTGAALVSGDILTPDEVLTACRGATAVSLYYYARP